MLVMRADPRHAAIQRILPDGRPLRGVQPGRPVDEKMLVALRCPERGPFGKDVALAALVEGGAGAEGAVAAFGLDVETGPFAGVQEGRERAGKEGVRQAGRRRDLWRRGIVHG